MRLGSIFGRRESESLFRLYDTSIASLEERIRAFHLTRANQNTGQVNHPRYLAHLVKIGMRINRHPEDVDVPLHEPEEQHDILRKLARVDAIEAKVQQQLELVDQLRRSIFFHTPHARDVDPRSRFSRPRHARRH